MSQQKHDEIMDHVVLNLRTVLKIIKEMEDDNKKLIAEVDGQIGTIMSENKALPSFKLISTAIDACPTSENKSLLEASDKIIDQMFRDREKVALQEFSNDILRSWIKQYNRARNIVNIEKSHKIYDALEKITLMLAGFKKYLEIEDEEGQKKEKPMTKKEDLPPKSRVVIGGDT